MMKNQIFIMAICLSVCIILGGCSGKNNEESSNEIISEEDITENDLNETSEVGVTETIVEETSEEVDESVQVIGIGETIYIEQYEFTLNKVEFTYDVLPDPLPSFYNHYEAESGMVYLHIDADIKNLQKQDLSCDTAYSVKMDYDDGYTYQGGLVPEDADLGFTYANITSIKPLESKGLHCLVLCPEEIETSDKATYIIITLLDGSEYKYIIR